jgi:hypothetical protein
VPFIEGPAAVAAGLALLSPARLLREYELSIGPHAFIAAIPINASAHPLNFGFITRLTLFKSKWLQILKWCFNQNGLEEH